MTTARPKGRAASLPRRAPYLGCETGCVAGEAEPGCGRTFAAVGAAGIGTAGAGIVSIGGGSSFGKAGIGTVGANGLGSEIVGGPNGPGKKPSGPAGADTGIPTNGCRSAAEIGGQSGHVGAGRGTAAYRGGQHGSQSGLRHRSVHG